jgi:redox-sensitive bicupin YhaK (pirin superfamily)
MTAGHGVVHAEESEHYRGTVSGVQLWVALPEASRHGPSAFEHHQDLPEVELGAATATVLVGALGGARSPARADTPLVGVDLAAHGGRTVLPLDATYEHAIVVLDGELKVCDEVRPRGVARLRRPRSRGAPRSKARHSARALLLGAAVATRRSSCGGTSSRGPAIDDHRRTGAWESWRGYERFGRTGSVLPPDPAPPVPWPSQT